MNASSDVVLDVKRLSGGFEDTDHQILPVLTDVTFSIRRGVSAAIVGESGSGKSITALSVLGLTPAGFSLTAGQIRFEGEDLLTMDPARRRKLSGRGLSMVFQDARAALNPVFTVGWQIADVVRIHQDVGRREARRRAEELLDRVRVPEPARRMKQYPHEFSGGMAQRAMLAMALACQPRLLILDEPTTGLDVTIQADILDLIADLKAASGMTTCLITHDLGVVAENCDQVVVMQQGCVRESGSCAQIINTPTDPYTKQLISDSRLVETS
ncbi:MAG: ABC transporter ATP-binding protein [Acidipropionibacterium sp.]|nr:ABC transporter ATP-binding protein [Acidipropionibacterium sp.]